MAQNMSLDGEIREVKGKAYPDLRFVSVKGVYVPNSKIEGAGVCPRIILGIGFAKIRVGEFLRGDENFKARIGAIAHELGHLVSDDYEERSADNEAIRRGTGDYLYALVKKIEEMGYKRVDGAYNSNQILAEVRYHNL